MLDMHTISAGLTLGGDGIWYASSRQEISYPPGGHSDCHGIEDSSFWFAHRNRCIATVVAAFPPKDAGAIFDIGGGNGFVSVALEKAGFDTVVVEPGPVGATNARGRGLRNVVCATIEAAGFKRASLPAVGLFDVLEHIEDDRAFLRTIKGLTVGNGRIYLTVPSYDFLWSREDVVAGHFRRYTRAQICTTLESAGLTVEFASYIFRFLPAPILLFRTLPYRIGLSKADDISGSVARDHAPVASGLAAGLLNTILDPEIVNLRNKRAMRFGASCLVVANTGCAGSLD